MQSIDKILADIESDINATELADVHAEATEVRRAEDATVDICQRLMGMRGMEVTIDFRDKTQCDVLVRDCGQGWMLGELSKAARSEVLIPVKNIVAVRTDASARVGQYSGPIARRLTFAGALRALADRHGRVNIWAQNHIYSGGIVRVGKDYVELGVDSSPILIHFDAIGRIETRGLR